MKTAKEFVAELKKNPELKEELMKLGSKDKVKEFMEKHEISGTEQELGDEVRKYMMESGELSDDVLENVSGGNIEWAPNGKADSPDAIVYEFNIGDRVRIYNVWYPTASEYGTVMERYYSPEGDSFFPCYVVNRDNGEQERCFQFNLSR